MERCPWREGFELYRQYHDDEWGLGVQQGFLHHWGRLKNTAKNAGLCFQKANSELEF